MFKISLKQFKKIWNKYKFCIKLFGTFILFFILFKKIDLNETFYCFKQINFLLFIPFLLYPVGIYLSTLKWKKVLNIKINFWKLFKIYWISNFFSNFLPSSVGGDSYKIVKLKKYGTKNIFISVLLDRGSGFFSLFLLLPFFLENKIYSLSIWSLLIISIFLIYFIPFKNQRMQKYQEIIKKNTKRNIQLIILSLLFIFLGTVSFYFYFLMFGYNLNFFNLASIYILLQLINAIPISFNGWGLREGSLVYFVGSLGVMPEMALAIALISRFASLVATGFGGILFLFDKKNVE